MLPFEILTLLTLALTLVGAFWSPAGPSRGVVLLPYLAALSVVLHLTLEGARWTMAPAYLLAALLLGLTLVGRARSVRRSVRPAPRRGVAAAGFVGGLALTGLAASLSAAFPVFELPAPTGPHAVGTTTLHLVDAGRDEPFTTDDADRRELVVQVWYPAEHADGAERAPYVPGGTPALRALSASIGLPPFAFDHLGRVRSHAVEAARPAVEALPALVFSHGYGAGFVGQNTVLMEELASHGYAVFSVTHPYESAFVAYPDGRVVVASADRLEEWNAAIGPRYNGWLEAAGTDDEAARWEEMLALPLAADGIRLWAADSRFVLDEIERLQAGAGPFAGHPLAGRLDLSRVGALGMSFGGATAGELVLADPRVKAGANLDGAPFGDAAHRPIERPFLFMTSGDSPGLMRPVIERATGPVYHAEVASSRHFDYSDIGLWTPVFRWIGFLGDIEPEAMLGHTSAYVRAFFDRHLLGLPAPLLDGADPNSGVTLHARPAATDDPA